MTHPLDTLIAAAREREAERELAAARQALEEEERRQNAMIDQLRREMARAFDDDLVAALRCGYTTAKTYPQCYAVFTYGGVDQHLWYTEQRNAREWHITRPGRSERDTVGKVVAEQECGNRLAFLDQFLLAIGYLAGERDESRHARGANMARNDQRPTTNDQRSRL